MKDNEIFENICSEYNIGKLVRFEKIAEGLLNGNYKITTENGNYFCKCVREKKIESVDTIYKVEKYMNESGVPAVTMLVTNKGTHLAQINDQIFTLYKFIESDRSHSYSSEDYFNMGKTLARIHLASQDSLPSNIDLKKLKNNDPEETKSILKKFKEKIEEKSQLDEYDKNFLSYINSKLDLLNTATFNNEISDHEAHLLHGDYHAGNLLIEKETRDIIGVCDWEKCERGSRAYEIARSMILLFSFDNSEGDIINAKNFITGYQSFYPITKKELIDGFKFRTNSIIKSKWIEDRYYNKNDSRTYQFVESEIKRINFFKPLILNGDASMLDIIF